MGGVEGLSSTVVGSAQMSFSESRDAISVLSVLPITLLVMSLGLWVGMAAGVLPGDRLRSQRVDRLPSRSTARPAA
jgi:hypothetical protein